MFYILPFSHSWLECLPVAILAAFIAGGCLPLKTSISQSQTFSLPESIALPEDCVHAELSPDNKWLACSRTSRGETQAGLWLIEIATRQMTAVALNQESQMSASGEVLEEGITHTYPLWSPDSRYLAFFSFKGLEPGSEYNLWIVGISDLADRKSLYESETPIIAAAWSPNGSKIALADTTGNLTLVDPSGHSEELADRDVAVYPLGANALAWSSDGSKLAYPASSSGGGLTLWSMDLLTGDRVSLLRTMQQDRIFIPAWSPDGKTTAVLSGRYSAEGLSENPQLVWIDSNGAIVEEVPLEDFELDLTATLVWSPKGNELAAVLRKGIALDAYLIALKDGRTRPLTDSGDIKEIIKWTPDGRSVVISTWDAIKLLSITE